jgi:hypothetical protein
MCNLSDTCDTWVIFCRMCVLCYLHEADMRYSAGSVYSVSYLRQYGGCLLWCTLSLTWRRLAGVCRGWRCTLSVVWSILAVVYWGVLCHLHEADWRFSHGVGMYSVIYMRQSDDCMHGAGVYSVIYIRQDGGCMLGVYSHSYMRQVGECPRGVCELCQLLQEGWRLSAADV